METIEIKKLLNEVGNTVHAINTTVIALTNMPENEIKIPEGLNISWKSKNLIQSIYKARNFVERSVYVFVAETLFEYLINISKNPFWTYPQINFLGNEKKAIKVYTFLKQIPNLSIDKIIISELLCHWRNKIVHSSTSKASLSKTKKRSLIDNKEYIYKNFHHFDVSVALKNFDENKVTLKDVSTITTIAINCCRAVDTHFFNGIKQIENYSQSIEILLEIEEFKKITKQASSKKKTRQVNKWLELYYPYLDKSQIAEIVEKL